MYNLFGDSPWWEKEWELYVLFFDDGHMSTKDYRFPDKYHITRYKDFVPTGRWYIQYLDSKPSLMMEIEYTKELELHQRGYTDYERERITDFIHEDFINLTIRYRINGESDE